MRISSLPRTVSVLLLSTVTCTLLALSGCVPAEDAEPVNESTEHLTVGQIEAQLRVDSEWASGYCAKVTLINHSPEKVSSYSVDIALGGTLDQIWNANSSLEKGTLTASGLPYNSSIPENGTSDFGFCVTKASANSTPKLLELRFVGGGAISGSGGAPTSDEGTSSGGNLEGGGATEGHPPLPNCTGPNPSVVAGVATFNCSKKIGQKFRVPLNWNKIVIEKNVTLTGSFYMADRTVPLEIMGRDRKTSILEGTGARPTDDGRDGRTYAAIRADKGCDIKVHDLTSRNPDKFHFQTFGTIEVERCDILETRGTAQTDGVHAQGGFIKNSFISVFDDATYVGDVDLIENTVIEHNKNGAPFQVSWGGNADGKRTIVRNCTIIDTSTAGYNQGVVGWAKKNSPAAEAVSLVFEGTNPWKVKTGARKSTFYTFSSGDNGAVRNATVTHGGTNCERTSSVAQRNESSGVVKAAQCI